MLHLSLFLLTSLGPQDAPEEELAAGARVLQQRCARCHGERRQRGGLRVDQREALLQGGDSGQPALVPGEPDHGSLIERVTTDDEDLRMPPSGARLDATQIELLRAWIRDGAPMQQEGGAVGSDHWAFTAPRLPTVPDGGPGARNPIDHFVRARLPEHGLQPAAEADRWTLVRRLFLDLTGLPPSPEEAQAFVDDPDPAAYEKLVDRLLASPHYGERWARPWLDLARYSDTHGYEKDRPRSMWAWRDWVVDALNRDLPFDRFTLQQLAGDLLEDAGESERRATGFHRNTMINEEGGIDVEEFRWLSVVDRVDTTGAVWLGLTVGCARCHTHKYDPITQREYWQLFDFLNQDDEIEQAVPDPEVDRRRAALQAEIDQRLAELPQQYVAEQDLEWETLIPHDFASVGGADLAVDLEGVIHATGARPGSDIYTLMAATELSGVQSLRIETLQHGGAGPGRSFHGNFVLTGIRVYATPFHDPDRRQELALVSAQADASQPRYDVARAIDGRSTTGWAIDTGERPMPERTATFRFGDEMPEGLMLVTVELEQAFGSTHTLGHFRLSLGRQGGASPQASFALAQRRWEIEASARATPWTAVDVLAMRSAGGATMQPLDDGSILVKGDVPNRDRYELEFEAPAEPLSALRLEVLPHPSLPGGGPGRAPLHERGDFLLSELRLESQDEEGGPWRRIVLFSPSASHAKDGRPIAKTLDGELDTGWSIGDRKGEPAHAVFALATPLDGRPGQRLRLVLDQHYIHQMTIGRLRLWTTGHEPRPATALSVEEEHALRTPATRRDEAQRALLREAFLRVAPELASLRAPIDELRDRLPESPSSLVLDDRGPEHRRETRLHARGEFLNATGDPLRAAVPAVLHSLPADARRDRLGLARWLVREDNPLIGRVTVNRAWMHLFGRGLVTTPEDFGTRGAPPSHPELLDWLAVWFVENGWSMKQLHRLMVTSATYRQSTHADAESWRLDPENRWLSRGPRFRLDAELLRDQALAASGLLHRELGGPGVFPPQPPGVTSLSYGSMTWREETGPNRWRRGLYTFAKRTAPYAAFATFDAPSGETCCTQRPRTNTPLQALVLLNDVVFHETAQALARRVMAEGDDEDTRLRRAFRLCVVRPPQADELEMLRGHLHRQRERLAAGELDAAALLGKASVEPLDDTLRERAAWICLARVLLNLDETVTRE